MTDIEFYVKSTFEVSELKNNVQKPLQESVSEYEKGLNDATSRALKNASFTASNFKAPETSTYEKLVLAALVGGSTGFVGGAAVGSVGGPAVLPAALSGALIGAIGGVATVLIEEMLDENEIRSQINFANLGLTVQESLNPAMIDKIVAEAQNTIFGAANETIAQLALSFERSRGETINFEDFLEIEHPEAANFFKPERIQQINELMKLFRGNLQETQAIQEKGNQITAQTNQINQEQAIISKDNAQAVMEMGESRSTAAIANKQLTETIKEQSGELKKGSEKIKLTEDDLQSLDSKLKMVGDGLVAGAGAQSEFAESTKSTVNQLKNESERITNLDPNLQNLAKSNENVAHAQEQMNQRIGDSSTVVDEASGSVEGYVDTIEKVQNTGGFFDGIKQGFVDFVENVESNSELMADFFADTLSNMSQNFSDFFYNAVTGKFESLADVAKNAFKSILKSFLDMVSAIATRQIVISIGGLFGIGKTAQAAGGGGNAADIAQQGAGVVGSGLGLFGSGGAFSTLGQGLGIVSPGIGLTGEIGPLGVPIIGELAGPGFMATAGAAVTVVGAVLAAAALAFTIIAPFLKKTPRLDIEFDEVKNDIEERAAVVAEFLDPEFFMDNIGQVSVKRGGVGIGAGGSNQILELIRERIEETIEGIQDIIAKLPTDMFRELNETLLGAEIDIDTVIAGERLLEFDAKGKKITEKFQQFIEGELPAKFFAAIRESFFEPAFRALGVSAEGTQGLIDKFMADMEAAGSREARAEVGAEFIATFNAFVDAFNIVSGNVNDSIGQTIQSINNLSAKLGFDAVPSIDELRKSLGEMIENAEIDAETVQAYADLRNAIVSLMAEITSAITGLIGKINQMNTTIVSLGGSAVDTTGFLNTAASQIQDFLNANMGDLSLSEQEGFLDQLAGIANDMLAQEQAAFEQAHKALVAAGEIQKETIQQNIDALTREKEAITEATQARIDSLNREKDRIQEAFNARIDALNEELGIAEDFARLTESIRATLDSILFSPQSVLTGVEQVNELQSRIAGLQSELAQTADPKRQLELAGQLEEAFKTIFDTAGEAFGVNSPEFVAIFDQVTGGLSSLAEMTGGQGRSVEEINAEIERLTAQNEAHLASIDARIESARAQSEAQLQAIDARIESMRAEMTAIDAEIAEHTFQASQELQELFEYIRTEYMRILEERFAQLEEASITGFATELEGLQAIAGIAEEHLVTLKEQTGLLTNISDALASLSGYNGGSGGLRDFGRGTLAVLHGTEAVVTEAQVRAMKKHMALAAEMTGGLGGALGGALETFAESIEGTGPVTRLGRELVGAGRLTELADRVGSARITSMMEEFAGMSAGGGAAGGLVERLAEKLSGEGGHISGLARRAVLEEAKNEMSVAISVNVNGGSGATVAGIGNEIENMLVRSIRQGGRLRSAIQEAGAKRMG